ncbi:MAG: hypothetical protein A2010_04730 [Nitrospirae bacterium GWD2_57_9]|nr:MAG: hypothetical protein A2010_04730 [Nitrospirae bacterium GWD2_57_9]OGW47093.1 MAG: hypothetical protein A2078_05610 [Nitrospirae bacterium GWC2_57_9]
MTYRILADITVLVHFLWIVFLIAGAYWGRKYRAVRNVHLAGMGFALVSQVFGWYCPLTHLEVWLRAHQDQAAAYAGSFIVYYTEKLIYISVSPAMIFVVTLVLIGINIFVYARTLRQAEGH